MSPLDIDEVKSLLQKYSVKPSKKSGQSFLKNDRIAKEIVDAAKLSSEDTVLEIGGGLGILTKWIARSGCSVKVVEIDPGLVAALKEILVDYKNVKIIEGDALKVNLPHCNKIVSNLPYSVSSEITFRILRDVQFEKAILMYQKEFANRLLAEPGSTEYSRLTIDFRYHADVERILDLSAQHFYPSPKVDSTVVGITRRTEGPFAADFDVFYYVVHGIYPYPNKHLRKALRIWFRNLGIEKIEGRALVERVSKVVSVNERLRGLSIDVLVRLSDTIGEMIEEGVLPGPRGESK